MVSNVEPILFFNFIFRSFLEIFSPSFAYHTYGQIINSNKGSNMSLFTASEAPPLGATDSEMPWEVGLTKIKPIIYTA